MQHNPLAGIKFEQTTGIICENCKNNTFQEVYMLRRVSKFLIAANTDKDQLLPIPVFSCSKCNHVNSEFLPQAIKDESDADASSSNNG